MSTPKKTKKKGKVGPNERAQKEKGYYTNTAPNAHTQKKKKVS